MEQIALYVLFFFAGLGAVWTGITIGLWQEERADKKRRKRAEDEWHEADRLASSAPTTGDKG